VRVYVTACIMFRPRPWTVILGRQNGKRRVQSWSSERHVKVIIKVIVMTRLYVGYLYADRKLIQSGKKAELEARLEVN
jgi:hypothetical protein